MASEFKLRIVEGRTASELEQKVEAVVQEIGGKILSSHYQRTVRKYLAFIEYVSKGILRSRVEVPIELPTSFDGEEFKTFKERVIDQAERTYLQNIFEKSGRNVSKASVAAGLSRYHLRKLLKKYDVYQPIEKKEEE